ncbi:unnamed protein product [Prorocentrum cordatum]|uniref:Autophagy-related protein 9 n=1 Tax=Prorocentrum cordatum TaxID=2364126 RepID=A0ABN9PS63_9DINO|nr:unnamed protein product [Polarella glacialis]
MASVRSCDGFAPGLVALVTPLLGLMTLATAKMMTAAAALDGDGTDMASLMIATHGGRMALTRGASAAFLAAVAGVFSASFLDAMLINLVALLLPTFQWRRLSHSTLRLPLFILLRLVARFLLLELALLAFLMPTFVLIALRSSSASGPAKKLCMQKLLMQKLFTQKLFAPKQKAVHAEAAHAEAVHAEAVQDAGVPPVSLLVLLQIMLDRRLEEFVESIGVYRGDPRVPRPPGGGAAPARSSDDVPPRGPARDGPDGPAGAAASIPTNAVALPGGGPDIPASSLTPRGHRRASASELARLQHFRREVIGICHEEAAFYRTLPRSENGSGPPSRARPLPRDMLYWDLRLHVGGVASVVWP